MIDEGNRLLRGSAVPGPIAVTRDSSLPDEVEACAGCGTLAGLDEPCPVCGRGGEDPLLGVVVSGRYRIDALVGGGGMGRVYRATHIDLGEPVAVKFLLPELSSRGELRARFRREAVALARLRHPNVVSVLDYGEHEGELFLVMELLRGFSLDSQVKAGGVTLPIDRVARVIDQVLQVLEAAHALGIVHRDLKPENVMLLDAGDRTDRVKVLDFGIALLDEGDATEKLTATGTIRGTPQYMSPEQCVGRGVGPASDVYAVGAMLYELLAGAPPFNGRSTAEIISQQMFSVPLPFAELSPPRDVPVGLEALCLRALSKRPERRPDAAAFRDALLRAVEGIDAVTVGVRDAAERARSAGLSRDERALSPAPKETPAEGSARDAGPSPRVALVGFEESRASTLRAALGTQGITAFPVSVLNALSPDKRPWKAVLIAGGEGSDARTRELRGRAEFATLPVVVADVPRASDTPSLIRAGASDCALATVDEVTLCQKVLRALRRGR